MALASGILLAFFGSHSADLPGDGLLLQQELQEAGSIVSSLLPGSVVVAAECFLKRWRGILQVEGYPSASTGTAMATVVATTAPVGFGWFGDGCTSTVHYASRSAVRHLQHGS